MNCLSATLLDPDRPRKQRQGECMTTSEQVGRSVLVSPHRRPALGIGEFINLDPPAPFVLQYYSEKCVILTIRGTVVLKYYCNDLFYFVGYSINMYYYRNCDIMLFCSQRASVQTSLVVSGDGEIEVQNVPLCPFQSSPKKQKKKNKSNKKRLFLEHL